jgi:endonuclease YncB( thermonuclease family)
MTTENEIKPAAPVEGFDGGRCAVDAGFGVTLQWHKGPAEGGQGSAGKNEDGVPQWWDGDRLLIIVETSEGREIAVVDINADEDYFDVRDASTGDTYDAWGPECWSWWAKLTKHNLPPNDQDQTRPARISSNE